MAWRIVAWLLLWATFAAGAAHAQDRAWVQVEARPTLDRAQEAAEGYAARLPDVSGFVLGSGWYGIALGPYAQDDARALLARLLAEGRVPADSFLTDGGQFRQQFWPVGVAAPTEPLPLPGAAEPSPSGSAAPEPAEPSAPSTAAPVTAAPDPARPDETPEEARASEALLTDGQKAQLQVALQWAGVYDGPIDGAYGRGTRAAMADWQSRNGRDITGILTSGERADLLRAYTAILDGLGLTLVRNEEAGIEVEVPEGVVGLAATEPPFVRFDATQDFPAQVILISQPGDQDRLFGLYEILQTLEVVPENGPRERRADGFTIEGSDGDVVSTTEVTLQDGAIKGFTLVWPAGDEERRLRLLGEMRASFRRLPGVLDPAAGTPTEDQAVDLVSGLQVRQPRLTATGFFVDGAGAVLTAADAVATCERVTIDQAHDATVAVADPALGLALLRPEEPLAPLAVATFQTAVPRLDAAVAVAGFPYGAALSRPALTFGRLADLRGLQGEDAVRRLSLEATPGDAGGPVLDAGGAVLGMLLPRSGSGSEGSGGEGQVLPDDVSYALDAQAILARLGVEGVEAQTTAVAATTSPERVTRDAAGLAVLVSCW